MVDYHEDKKEVVINTVRLTDLDNAAYLPNGRYIQGMLAGNANWRSPEAFLKSKLNKPTDMFSFGVVCTYAVLGRAIFAPDADFETRIAQGVLPDLIHLQRQVSYFGDEDAIAGLEMHLGDDSFSRMILRMLWTDRWEPQIGYKQFGNWPEVEDMVFMDLVLRLRNLDPKRRMTAQEALEHQWFEDV